MKLEKTVKIIIATHKPYRMPEDPMYFPLHVGAEGKTDEHGAPLDFGYQKDNTGENISLLNPSFCEITGLYWAWKNLDADYIGLAHYRRHFALKKGTDLWSSVLTYRQLAPYLDTIRVFTPSKRRYYIETLYSHYKHTHYASQLDETRKILSERYPDYVSAYDKVIKRRYGYMFNMMIMEKTLFDQYCTWLFDILFELKDRIGDQQLSVFQGRFYGRISEIVFNVWLEHMMSNGTLKRSEHMEIPVIHMEKVNWWKKGSAFLKAKFMGKKYEGSF